MRRSMVTAGAVLLWLVPLTPRVAGAASSGPANSHSGPADVAPAYAAENLSILPKPAGANPFLAELPDQATADYSGWRAYLAQQSAIRAAAKPKAGVAPERVVRYDEHQRGGTGRANDTPASAQHLWGFGTRPGQASGARVVGRLDPEGDDTDFFSVDLRKGDVLGASVTGSAGHITIFDTVPREVHGSSQDLSYIYPPNSPLPVGGNAITDHVATENGRHYIGVSDGAGAYDITVKAFRPPLEGHTPPVQTLFLDFDGARLDRAIFPDSESTGEITLSPFAGFVPRWGFAPSQEGELIDAITARVTENLRQDLIASGVNDRFRLVVTNSKDDPDAFGRPNVSRIVIGGTIEELGLTTIGLAQSIDPGNFEGEETAVVLLDTLSNPDGAASQNTYLTPASDRTAFVARGIGDIAAHEAGHLFGNWHTDRNNGTVNLQDSGGHVKAGVGPDGIGGTADDVDLDFGEDVFLPAEGFTGTEDTLGRIAYGVTS